MLQVRLHCLLVVGLLVESASAFLGRAPPAAAKERKALAAAPAKHRPSLFIVSNVWQGSANFTAALDAAIARRMGPHDRQANICGFRGSDCHATLASGSKPLLNGVVELPQSYLEVFPGKCSGPHCTDRFSVAKMKYTAGLVHQVRKLKRESAAGSAAAMPDWWLIKDDDTYVHVPNLMAAVRDRGADPSSLVAFGHYMPVNFHGGGGILLSAALAETLAVEMGDQLLREHAEALPNNMASNYDYFLGKFIKQNFKEWRSIMRNMMEMQQLQIDGAPCVTVPLESRHCRQGGSGGALLSACTCKEGGYRLQHCRCARAAKPATWHLKGKTLELIEQADASSEKGPVW